MSGMWKRSHGRTSKAPPDERGGYRYVRPTATAPHLDSTHSRHRRGEGRGRFTAPLRTLPAAEGLAARAPSGPLSQRVATHIQFRGRRNPHADQKGVYRATADHPAVNSAVSSVGVLSIG